MAVDPLRLSVPVERDGVPDRVAIEDPLEIRVRGEALAVTMRTPGHDEELALGFLHGEGLIGAPAPAGPPPDLAANIVDVDAQLSFDPGRRRFYTTSSCGVCGKGALEEIAVHAPALPSGPQVPRTLLADLLERLRQPAFEATGGLHANGLFDAGGTLLLAREDVGRHNAMDKVVGRAARRAAPAPRPPAVRVGPAVIRARAEGGGRRRPGARRRRRADLAGGGARR